MFAHPGGSGIRGSPYHHPYFADESRSSPALRRLGNPPAEEEAEIVERLGHGPGHLGVGEVAESLVAEQAAQRCGEPAVEVGHAEDGDPQAPVLVDEEESSEAIMRPHHRMKTPAQGGSPPEPQP